MEIRVSARRKGEGGVVVEGNRMEDGGAEGAVGIKGGKETNGRGSRIGKRRRR